jgi:hypothetical protein
MEIDNIDPPQRKRFGTGAFLCRTHSKFSDIHYCYYLSGNVDNRFRSVERSSLHGNTLWNHFYGHDMPHFLWWASNRHFRRCAGGQFFATGLLEKNDSEKKAMNYKLKPYKNL